MLSIIGIMLQGSRPRERASESRRPAMLRDWAFKHTQTRRPGKEQTPSGHGIEPPLPYVVKLSSFPTVQDLQRHPAMRQRYLHSEDKLESPLTS